MHVKEKVVPKFWIGYYYLAVWSKGLWKITKIPSQGNRFLYGDMNSGPLEYEADLLTRPRCSSFFVLSKSFAICCDRIFFEFIFSKCFIVACAANAAERAYNSSGEMACGLMIIGVVV